MTVSAQETIFRHVGNGVTTVFAYGCQVLQPNDLYVYVDGVEITSGITKNGIGSLTGGTVTFSAAPANGAAIIIEREVALERTTDYQQNGDFLARVVNPDFNRIWMVLQQLLSGINRALRFPKSDVNPVTELPDAATRADKLLSFDSAGNPIAVAPVAGTASALSVLLASVLGTSLIGFLQAGAGAVLRTLQDKIRERSISIKDFGAVGNGIADDTAAILAAKAYAIANLPMKVFAPRGTYNYTDIGNWAYSGLTLEGESHLSTIFKCTGAGSAFVVDAFQPGFTGDDATAPYTQAFNLKNITIKGNAATAIIIEVRGVSRSAWENVCAAEGAIGAGIAFQFQAVQLNSFYNLICSTNLGAMVSKPYEGLRLSAGSRNGVSVGNSSNNTFVNLYMEGLSIGMRVTGGDQNQFISGASEANSVYDLLIAAGSRYNTFSGMGFESGASLTANISDGGTYTKYLNCYANKSVLLAGIGIEVSGGFFHRIEMQAAANRCRVHNVHVKNWESTFPGAGGFIIAGGATAPEWRNVYDVNAAVYVYPHRARTGITVGASPFQWLNNTGQYVEVIIQTGTISQVLVRRGSVGGVGGDTWLNPITLPNKHLLAPNDILEVSYSVSPGMSYVPHNGFQG